MPLHPTAAGTTHVAPAQDVSFNFVGRKGANATAGAPYRVGPPDAVFLNNQLYILYKTIHKEIVIYYYKTGRN